MIISAWNIHQMPSRGSSSSGGSSTAATSFASFFTALRLHSIRFFQPPPERGTVRNFLIFKFIYDSFLANSSFLYIYTYIYIYFFFKRCSSFNALQLIETEVLWPIPLTPSSFESMNRLTESAPSLPSAAAVQTGHRPMKIFS